MSAMEMQLKYFVLNPSSSDEVHGLASRAALQAYATVMAEHGNVGMAQQCRAWAHHEGVKATQRMLGEGATVFTPDGNVDLPATNAARNVTINVHVQSPSPAETAEAISNSLAKNIKKGVGDV
jgi:hypothetical protein